MTLNTVVTFMNPGRESIRAWVPSVPRVGEEVHIQEWDEDFIVKSVLHDIAPSSVAGDTTLLGAGEVTVILE